jgi:hypothetical protein
LVPVAVFAVDDPVDVVFLEAGIFELVAEAAEGAVGGGAAGAEGKGGDEKYTGRVHDDHLVVPRVNGSE